MVINNKTRSLNKRVLYRLKRDHGSPIDIYHVVSETQDLTTGKKIIIKEKYHIKRAIVLPTLLARQLSLAGAFRVARGFTPGELDVAQRFIIIDDRDLVADIDAKDYVVIDHERYDIRSVEELEDKNSTLLDTRIIKGGEASEILEYTIKQKLSLVQSSEGII